MEERVKVGKLTVRIEQDTDASNPRTEYDNFGTMVCFHRRYDLGDKHEWKTPQDFMESEEYKTAAVILPLGLYDHSGITMYVGSQAHMCDPGGWDSGQVGWIYASKDAIRSDRVATSGNYEYYDTGFHVFISKEDAEWAKEYLCEGDAVVPVEVRNIMYEGIDASDSSYDYVGRGMRVLVAREIRLVKEDVFLQGLPE